MTPFWNAQTGALALHGELLLTARMSRAELSDGYRKLTGAEAVWDDVPEPVLCLPACEVEGGAVAPLCYLHDDKLHAVTCAVTRVGDRHGTATEQRAFLFALLRANDPDSTRHVLLRCAFGTALITSDPRTGDALLRVTYR